MWRVGHDYAEKKAGKAGRKLPSVSKQTSSIEKKEISKKASNIRQKLPGFNPKMIDPKTRRGSLIAAEYLMRRRSSRAGKHLPLIATDGGVSLDHIKQGQHARRPSVAVRLGRFNEIKERINKVMTNYDAPSSRAESEDTELINEIEDGLMNIEDDMMRINVSSLISRYKKLQRYCDETNIAKSSALNLPERTNEALQALQDWVDQDRFDDTDDDEPQSHMLDVMDKEVVSAEISQVSEKMEKLKILKQRIRDLKTAGNDTTFLERQKEHLQSQMRNEVIHLQEQNKNENKSADNRDFAYIKNASTEIYDLIQRTKIEGMAHAHQFEEQLNMILKELDKKKRQLTSLQKWSDSQKEMIDKWSDDYEKLHNELIMTADERNDARDSNRELKREIEKLKHKQYNIEISVKSGEFVTKAEHEDALADLEKSLKHAKQNLVVISKTLKEKNNQIIELNQQSSRLKSSLRKHSSISLHSDTSFHQSTSDLSGRHLYQRKCMSQESSKSLFSSTDSFLHQNQDSIIASLKEEIETLRDKLLKAKNFNRARSEADDSHQSGEHIITARKFSVRSQSQETQTAEAYVPSTGTYKESNIAIGDAPQIQQVMTESVECQTLPPAVLPSMSSSVREDFSKTCQMLSERIGPDWMEVALKFSSIEREDVVELNRGLVVQSDIVRMYSGSPTKTQRFYESETEIAQESQMEKVIEQMLQGEIPDRIELKKLDSARAIDCHLQDITSRVATYVSSVKNAVNNQAGMMSEVNDCLKQNIPTEERDKLEVEIGTKQKDVSCSEHSKEWHEMDSLEQANCKMRYIEETICNLMKETNKIYETEIDKQHETYKNLHNIVKKNVDTVTFQNISENIKGKIKNIKGKAKSRASQERTKILQHSHTPMILSSPFKSRTNESQLSIGLNRVDSSEDVNTKVRKILSGYLWNYAGKPTEEHHPAVHKQPSEYQQMLHKPDAPQTQYGLSKNQYYPGIKTHALGGTGYNTPIKKGKGKTGKHKSRGLGLLVQPASHYDGEHLPRHTEKNLSLFLNNGLASHARGSIFARRDRPQNHNKFTRMDVHSNFYDPKMLQKDVSFGIENAKSFGGAGIRKYPQIRKKHFLEPKSPFMLRS